MGAKFSNFEETVAEAIYTENVRELTELLGSIPLEDCKRALSTTLPYDEHGRSLLHLAAWSDNHDLLATMLQRGPEVNVEDCYGWTPLMVCLYRGNMQGAYALLQKSAQFDPDTKEARWLLQYAVRRELPATASFLLERGVKMDESTVSLLNIAVDTGNVAMTRLLLDKNKCNPNVVDDLGWAPLHLASGHDNLPIVRLLLEFGADVNIKDKNGNTPLAWAKKYDSRPVIEELERLNATCDAQWHGPEHTSHYEATVDYTSVGGSENGMPSQDDSGASAEEYLDEYRNAMWVETNAEMQAIALSEVDALYDEDVLGEEYQIDSNIYGPDGYLMEMNSGSYPATIQVDNEPSLEASKLDPRDSGIGTIAGDPEVDSQQAVDEGTDQSLKGEGEDKPLETKNESNAGKPADQSNKSARNSRPAESATIIENQNAMDANPEPIITKDDKADEASEKLKEHRIDISTDTANKPTVDTRPADSVK